ncbi:MAG: 3-deoxy-7-phosphoheptulonate synthase [Zetaproteobacteria bacterium]|nr:MAG: 3-deoxy-7-phosphoheptulonate synthase [Zetaproteobacteria bacterium]
MAEARYKTDDLRIRAVRELMAPHTLHSLLPISDRAAETVWTTRRQIHEILHNRDDRLLVVTGPCSIHDPESAIEYGQRLLPLRRRLDDALLIVMRVYFEKPRTTVGWKGLINDPGLDESFEINRGIRLARKLLLDLNELGVPAGTEFLDLITPQYFADLVSWGAIGARTTESQGHRELASGLSCPVGFKNGTDGGLKVAIDAIAAAAHPHHFLSLTKAGQSAIFSTSGNEDCHIILRGGKTPNFDHASVREACNALDHAGITSPLMIDFSHGNSGKKPERQIDVCHNVAGQIAEGNRRIGGVMIESHLHFGRQDVLPGVPLKYGVSITDACLDWARTEPLLHQLAEAVRTRRALLSQGRPERPVGRNSPEGGNHCA